MLLTCDLRAYDGAQLGDVAAAPDGTRYFQEPDGSWQHSGARAREWRALLAQFRRSDWHGYHLGRCPCNQYLVARCTDSCTVLTRMLYDRYGGFPADFSPPRDENNRYRSSAESYG